MMNANKDKKIEEILSSLDGAQRASAPDFFYTRLKARMEKELVNVPGKAGIWRPAYAFAALLLVLVINAFVILNGNQTKDTSATDIDVTQSIAAEYNINSNLTYEINQ